MCSGCKPPWPTGELIRTGGKVTKLSTGYDLTQLIIGSEGTLALATEVTVRLYPRLAHAATLLVPFADLPAVMRAVPAVVRSGVDPNILEYIDNLTLAALSYSQNLNLGIPDSIRDAAEAYLVIGVEDRDHGRLDDGVTMLGELLESLGALDLYVLEGNPAHALIEAREKAFWTAKATGADDVIDTVVPRAQMHQFITRAKDLALAANGGVVGCGHAATATCTWRCSAPTTTSGTGCCTTSSRQRWSSAARSPVNTVWAGPRCNTSWIWRIRSR